MTASSLVIWCGSTLALRCALAALSAAGRPGPRPPQGETSRQVWRSGRVRSGPTARPVAVAGVASLILGPALAAAAAASAMVVVAAGKRRRARRRADVVVKNLALFGELLAVGLAAGLGVIIAVRRAAARGAGPVFDELDIALTRHERGEPLDQALEAAFEGLPAEAQRLRSVITAHHLDGVTIRPALATMTASLRAERRHRSELVARRLPVRMLGPLVICVLPAFMLLTVVPVVVDGLRLVVA